jgi:hypothetical protein
MTTTREIKYWEILRNMICDIIDERRWCHIPVLSWEAVRKEAVERLYVRGIFQDIGLSTGDA